MLRHGVLEVKQLAISVLLMEVAPPGDPVDVVGQDCNGLRHPFGSIGVLGDSHLAYKLNTNQVSRIDNILI